MISDASIKHVLELLSAIVFNFNTILRNGDMQILLCFLSTLVDIIPADLNTYLHEIGVGMDFLDIL